MKWQVRVCYNADGWKEVVLEGEYISSMLREGTLLLHTYDKKGKLLESLQTSSTYSVHRTRKKDKK